MASLDRADLDMIEMSDDGHIAMSPFSLSSASSLSAKVANSRSATGSQSTSTGNAASIAQSALARTQRIVVAPQSSSSRQSCAAQTQDAPEDVTAITAAVADRSEAEIARLTWALLALAAGVLGFLLVGLISWGPRPWLGWVGVVAASVIFSTTTIPMKLPSVGAAGADPFLFALCTGIGILLVSLPVTAYLVLIGQFAFIAWPALSATLIFMIGYFALNAVALLGVAIAPGCWSGVGMMCAFVLGSAAFREPIARVDAAAAAVALLVVGIACVSSSKTPPPAESQASSPESVDAADEAPFIRAKLYRGLAFCLATGLADGCLMVPFKLARAETLIDSFNYLACFGFWGGLLSPAYYALYLYATGAPRPTVAAIRVAAFPGLSSGVLWAVAFFGSTMGTFFIGLSIAFPLTQTCAVLSAFWGMLYFRESVGRPWRFAAGLACVIVGSYFLAASRGRDEAV